MIAGPAAPEAPGPLASKPEGAFMVFNRKQLKTEERRADAQSALVEMLMDADDLARRKLLLMALQTGELKKSEAADLLRLVERLESISGRG